MLLYGSIITKQGICFTWEDFQDLCEYQKITSQVDRCLLQFNLITIVRDY